MTTQALERTAAALAAIDARLAALPASGRVALEIQANREQLGETARLVAQCLRESAAGAPTP